MKPLKVLYAGDSPVGGAANYLLGILNSIRAEVTHLAPSEKMTEKILERNFDVIIFSDYSRDKVSDACQAVIARKTAEGTGFLMIGGWGSYSGPFGNWRGSFIETLLPVDCKKGDDRTNFPGGASLVPKLKHPVLKGLSFAYSPAICGMNEIYPKKKSRVVLAVRKILSTGRKISLEKKEYPLLVLDSQARIAALATDLAPHWCGGLVDWGSSTKKLAVNSQIRIQVGISYIHFVSSLISWLGGR